MRSFLSRSVATVKKPKYPTVILMLQRITTSTRSCVLHIVPEDGTTERVDTLSHHAKSFKVGGSRERSREQIGTISFHGDENDNPGKFLDKVSATITAQPLDREARSEKDILSAIESVLRSTAHDMINNRSTEASLATAGQLYSIYLVQVNRSETGKIWNFEPTSFPERW